MEPNQGMLLVRMQNFKCYRCKLLILLGQQLDLEQHLHGSAYGSPTGYGTITGTNAGKSPKPKSYSKCLVPQLMDMDNAMFLLHSFVLQILSM